MTQQDRDSVIRECIAALPKPHGDVQRVISATCGSLAIYQCRTALEALLPKPDPVEELVSAWLATAPFAPSDCAHDSLTARDVRKFSRWLIQSGKIEVKG